MNPEQMQQYFQSGLQNVQYSYSKGCQKSFMRLKDKLQSEENKNISVYRICMTQYV
jgi:hypothetical protein